MKDKHDVQQIKTQSVKDSESEYWGRIECVWRWKIKLHYKIIIFNHLIKIKFCNRYKIIHEKFKIVIIYKNLFEKYIKFSKWYSLIEKYIY